MATHKIYCGDCIDVMKEFDDECTDLVITSPPYDNLRDYKGYLFDFENTAKEIFRIIKEGGVVVWVVGDATKNGSETGTSFRQALFFKEIGFNLHDTMIWNKGSCRYPETNRYYPTFEYMFIFTKGTPKTHNLISDRKNIYAGSKVARGKQVRRKTGEIVENSAFRNDKNRKIKKYGVRFNVWQVAVSASIGDKIALAHPASFPEQLAHDHIYSWSNEGDLILDPFVGSGTTLVACERLKRDSIGIETSPDYCKLSYKRLKTKLNKEQSTIQKIGF